MHKVGPLKLYSLMAFMLIKQYTSSYIDIEAALTAENAKKIKIYVIKNHRNSFE